MADGLTGFPIFLISFVAGAAVIISIFVSKLVRRVTITKVSIVDAQEQSKIPLSSASKKSLHQSQLTKPIYNKKYGEKQGRDAKQQYHHQWLLTSLKGHSSNILDMEYSPNGKFLATCGEDRAILLWNTHDWNCNDHKNIRVNVEYDYPSMIRWSLNSKTFIIKRQRENVIEVYKILRSNGSVGDVVKVVTYPKFHEEDIIGLGISYNGKYIMSSSKNTDIVISDFKGAVLTRLDTHLMHNYSARLSPCGKFIAASGFASDAKVWEVQLSKAGEFAHASRLCDLRGHHSDICDVSFDALSSKIGTVSKDGTWKLFNVAVDHRRGETPSVISSGKFQRHSEVSRISVSPQGDVVAVAFGSTLLLYKVESGKLDATITDVFTGAITSLLFDSAGKYILVAGERHVRVFHNVTGMKALAENARNKLEQGKISSAMTERLKEQISSAEAFVASFST